MESCRTYAVGDRLPGGYVGDGPSTSPWLESSITQIRHALTAYLDARDPDYTTKRNEAMARTGSRFVECFVITNT